MAAHLGQKGDQRGLAQEGRFTGHVGAGQQPDRRGIAGQVGVIGDEGRAVAAQRLFDHRVSAAGDAQGAVVGDLRAAPVFGNRQIGKRGGEVEFGQRAGGVRQVGRAGEDFRFQPVIEPFFDIERAAPGVEDAGLHLAEFRRGKAQLVGGGLAMLELFVQRFGQHLVGVGRGDLDEIAQHVVVLDLDRGDARKLCVFGLHRRDDATAFVAQLAGFV